MTRAVLTTRPKTHVGAWTMGCSENVSLPVVLVHAGLAMALYAIAFNQGARSGTK